MFPKAWLSLYRCMLIESCMELVLTRSMNDGPLPLSRIDWDENEKNPFVVEPFVDDCVLNVPPASISQRI